MLYDKVVVRNRGGYCYELNGLFHDLLEAMGFNVWMLSAQVRREDGSFGPDFDHMLLKVSLDDLWFADVGFGESFVNPLRLAQGASSVEVSKVFGVTNESGLWELFQQDKDGSVALYRFSEAPRQLADFEGMNVYQQTSPESGFTRRRVCSRATPNGRITLAGMRLIVTREGEREERVLQGEAELRQCLREQFSVELDQAADWAKLMG